MNELKELETELAPRKKASRKDRVKNIAIVFLAVLLVFTFFSNTIMNRSLPEVSGQYAGSGTISTSIRGTGTVTANMAYSVQIENTRQIRAVYVKSGDTVEAGQVLFALEDADSQELKDARQALRVDCLHTSAGSERALKHDKFALLYSAAQVNQAHLKTRIRFIRAVIIHGILPRHAGQG